jgi:hypothetical protein
MRIRTEGTAILLLGALFTLGAYFYETYDLPGAALLGAFYPLGLIAVLFSTPSLLRAFDGYLGNLWLGEGETIHAVPKPVVWTLPKAVEALTHGQALIEKLQGDHSPEAAEFIKGVRAFCWEPALTILRVALDSPEKPTAQSARRIALDILRQSPGYLDPALPLEVRKLLSMERVEYLEAQLRESQKKLSDL